MCFQVERPDRESKMHKPRKKASLKAKLLLAASPFLLLFGAEIALRLFAPEPTWDHDAPVLAEMVRQMNQIEGDLQEALSSNPRLNLTNKGHELYIGDRLLFWRLKPGYTDQIYNYLSPLVWNTDLIKQGLYERAKFRIKVSPQGYAKPVFSKRKDEGVFRLICIGDSNTFGWGVEPDECYPAVLTGLLEEALPEKSLEIINMGVPGYSSLQGRLLVEEEVLDLEPDLVVACYGFNDTWYVTRPDAANLARASGLAGRMVSLLTRFRLIYWGGRLFKNCFSGASGGEAELGLEDLSQEEIEALKKRSVRRVSPEAHRANIAALCGSLEKHGTEVILLDMFCQGPWHSAMREAAGEWNVPVVDGEGYLTDVLKRVQEGDPALEELRLWALEKYTALALDKDPRLYIFNDNCHANPEGYRLLARLVADEVIKCCFQK